MTKLQWILVTLTMGALFLLRFLALGHSDYIPDETTVMYPIKQHQLTGYNPLTYDFFMQQRKGPVQFVVAYLVSLTNTSVYNGFLYRLPFVFANVFGLYFFFLFVRSATRNFWVALLSLCLLGLSGMIIGFGRIVQYQSFNLLFSSLALYFFTKPKYKLNPLTGVFLALSFLTHWDAVFVLPIMFILLLKRKYYKEKMWLLVNLASFLIILLPFLVPYLSNFSHDVSNQAYFSSRIEFSLLNFVNTVEGLITKTNLYNPFLYGYFMLTGLVLSFFFIKKSYSFVIWGAALFALFSLFVKAPGTHLYNLLLPGVILVSIGIVSLGQKINAEYIRYVYVFLIFSSVFFFYNQANLIFTQVRTEYPWEQEHIYKYKTKEYSAESLTNNILGFPIKRGWVEIRNYVKYQGPLEQVYSYVTNENNSIANFYLSDLDMSYGDSEDKYYAIGIKRPLSFVNDYTFPQIKDKDVVHRISIGGNTTARIYLVNSVK